MEDLKVSDLVNLKKEDFVQTKNILKSLALLSEEYHLMEDMYDPNQLEIIKRNFDREMQHLATYFSKVKKFKGSSHTYLDDVRKKIKGEALQILLDEGAKITSAETLVYKSKYYLDRVNLMEDIKEFMINVELMYERYDTTYNSIVQSLSTAKKEIENSKK